MVKENTSKHIKTIQLILTKIDQAYRLLTTWNACMDNVTNLRQTLAPEMEQGMRHIPNVYLSHFCITISVPSKYFKSPYRFTVEERWTVVKRQQFYMMTKITFQCSDLQRFLSNKSAYSAVIQCINFFWGLFNAQRKQDMIKHSEPLLLIKHCNQMQKCANCFELYTLR